MVEKWMNKNNQQKEIRAQSLVSLLRAYLPLVSLNKAENQTLISENGTSSGGWLTSRNKHLEKNIVTTSPKLGV